MWHGTVRSSGTSPRNAWPWVGLGLLGFLLLLLFLPSFRPGWVLFLNDGPYAALQAGYNHIPEAFFGIWQDLNWVGANGGSLSPCLTFGELAMLGPLGFAKFHAPVALLFLGTSVYVGCRWIGFSPPVSTLTGLAAALNSNLFSNACWGLSSRAFLVGVTFLAVGAISSPRRSQVWVRCTFAGLAVGMGILEAADIGVIFSLAIAAFTLVTAIGTTPGQGRWGGIGWGGVKVGVIAVFAAVVAWQSIDTLVFRARVLDAVASQRERVTPEQQWDWATQWSLPKVETLRLVVPGLHGYRMDSPEGGRYWGAAGRDPAWDRTRQGLARYSGAGEYAGIGVVVLALFAGALAVRRGEGSFSPGERRAVCFWGGVAILSLLLAWGRHAPFYQLIYPLPYFSSVRNPIKWMHLLHLALLLLSAYGLEGLARRCLRAAGAGARSIPLRERIRQLDGFDRAWSLAAAALAVVSLVAAGTYACAGESLIHQLQESGIARPGENIAELAASIAAFSQREAGIAAFLLVLFLVLVAACQLRCFTGGRASYAWGSLAVCLVGDLARADHPWVRHFNFVERYASNPVLDAVKGDSTRGRITLLRPADPSLDRLRRVYHRDWLQHHFQYHGIPALELAQDPRPLPETVAFRGALQEAGFARLWELTGVTHVVGPAGLEGNGASGGVADLRGRLRPLLRFDLPEVAEGRVVVVTNSSGPFSLYAFDGAQPRVKLFQSWESGVPDGEALQRITSSAHRPGERVIVSEAIPSPEAKASASATETGTGRVELQECASKRIRIRTEAPVGSILRVSDKHDPSWGVWVDGREAPLLRCDYLFRGVALPAGVHEVEFRFHPPVTGFFVSLGGVALLVFLGAYLAWAAAAPRASACEVGPGESGEAGPERAAA